MLDFLHEQQAALISQMHRKGCPDVIEFALKSKSSIVALHSYRKKFSYNLSLVQETQEDKFKNSKKRILNLGKSVLKPNGVMIGTKGPLKGATKHQKKIAWNL